MRDWGNWCYGYTIVATVWNNGEELQRYSRDLLVSRTQEETKCSRLKQIKLAQVPHRISSGFKSSERELVWVGKRCVSLLI